MPTRKEKLRKKRHEYYIKGSNVQLLVSDPQSHISETNNGIESNVLDSNKKILVKNGVDPKSKLTCKYVAPIKTRFSLRLASKAGKAIPEVNIADVSQTSTIHTDKRIPTTNVVPLKDTMKSKIVAPSKRRFSVRLASKVAKINPLVTISNQAGKNLTTTAVFTQKRIETTKALYTKPTLKSKNGLPTKTRFSTQLPFKVGRTLPVVSLPDQTLNIIQSPVDVLKKRTAVKKGIPSKSILKTKTGATTKQMIPVTLDPKVVTTTPLVRIPQTKQQPWRKVSRQLQPVSQYRGTVHTYFQRNIRMAEIKQKIFQNRVVSNVMRNAKKVKGRYLKYLQKLQMTSLVQDAMRMKNKLYGKVVSKVKMLDNIIVKLGGNCHIARSLTPANFCSIIGGKWQHTSYTERYFHDEMYHPVSAIPLAVDESGRCFQYVQGVLIDDEQILDLETTADTQSTNQQMVSTHKFRWNCTAKCNVRRESCSIFRKFLMSYMKKKPTPQK